MFDSELTQVIDMGEAQPVSICDVVRDFLRIFSHRGTFPRHLIIPRLCQNRINKQTLRALCSLSVHPTRCSFKRKNRLTEASLTAIPSRVDDFFAFAQAARSAMFPKLAVLICGLRRLVIHQLSTSDCLSCFGFLPGVSWRWVVRLTPIELILDQGPQEVLRRPSVM